MAERKEQCETCKWWVRGDPDDLYENEAKAGLHLSDEGDGLDIGECRRFPPAVSDEQMRQALCAPLYKGSHYFRIPLGVLNAGTVFPHTFEFDFCGEWQAGGNG